MSANRTQVALSLVGSGQRVLDVGCGMGAFLGALEGRFAERHGVEIDPQRAATSRAQGHRVVRVDLDRTGLPYRGASFDCVTLLDVLEHVREPLDLLAEVERVLRPGGQVLVSTPNIRHWRHLVSIAWAGRFPRTSDDPAAYDGGHLHYFTFADVTALLQKVGLDDCRPFPILNARRYEQWRRWVGGHVLREFVSAGLMIEARRGAAGREGRSQR